MPATKPDKFTIRIKRQDDRESEPYWHEFNFTYRPNLNITTVLQEIAATPVTSDGRHVTPVNYEAACLEEVCGSCTMVINRHVRQGCACLIDELLENHGPVITIEPMSKFPVIRDLVVDRTRLFKALEKLKGWVPIDGTYDLGPGPRESPEQQEMRYALSRCMSCGCCLEACPQYTIDNDFIGPHAFAQAALFNLHETGKKLKSERLQEAMMGPGGITDCGNAQNCVKVCPQEVPITDAIAQIGRQTTVEGIKKFFSGR